MSSAEKRCRPLVVAAALGLLVASCGDSSTGTGATPIPIVPRDGTYYGIIRYATGTNSNMSFRVRSNTITYMSWFVWAPDRCFPLAAVSCESDACATLAAPVAIENGRFTVRNGNNATGVIIGAFPGSSSFTATGTIEVSTASCSGITGTWSAGLDHAPV